MSTAAKIGNNEDKNSTLNFLHCIKTNGKININLNTLNMVVAKLQVNADC